MKKVFETSYTLTRYDRSAVCRMNAEQCCVIKLYSQLYVHRTILTNKCPQKRDYFLKALRSVALRLAVGLTSDPSLSIACANTFAHTWFSKKMTVLTVHSAPYTF